MPDVEYRTFRPGDVDPIVALIATSMPADPISLEWFTENVLLDPNFDPDGLIIAVESAGSAASAALIGFVYAVRGRATAGIPVDPDGGWLTIGAVHPRSRRQGIGTELVRRAKAFLSRQGAGWVTYAAYPPAYFLPGLDSAAYPAGLGLLEQHGFRTVSRPVAMDLGLAAYATPDDVIERRAAREAEGYTFAPALPDDLPEVIAFAAAQLAPDWGEAIREAVVRHRRPDRVLLVRDPERRAIGFATYGAYRGLLERFGPFGVVPAHRGLGLGKILLHATLARMRAEGAHSAWFLWTGLDTPAGRLYVDAGFTVTREFNVMRAELEPPGS